MIQSIDAIVRELRGTPLEGRTVRELWPSGRGDSIFVVELKKDRREDEWKLLRSLQGRTGRYPVLTTQDYLDLDFSDHPPHDLERSLGWIEKVAAECLLVDPTDFLHSGSGSKDFSPNHSDDLFGWLDIPLDHWDHALDKTRRRFGEGPSIKEIRRLRDSGTLRTDADLERWLFEWEIERFGSAALIPNSTGYLDGYEFDDGCPCMGVLLPTPWPWTALLYMGWWGLDGLKKGRDVEKATALRVWGEKYGAELVGSFITTLHLRIARRPQTAAEAFNLAVEHYHFAADTLILPGVSLRDHARSLLSMDRWFFHSRP